MANIAIFASGNGSNFEVIAKSFIDDKTNKIAVLICDIKNAFVLDRAKRLNINSKIVEYKKDKKFETENEILKILKEYKIDIVLLAGFMKILSGNFIKFAGIPIINIHPALLPKYKGTHAIERAFNSLDEEIGISIHYVTEEVDSGEIIIQKSIPLKRELGLEKVEEKVHELEHKWYPIIAKEICDKLNKVPLK